MFLGYNGTTYELLVSFCNFLSYTVVGVTCIYKAPQVYAVVSSGSSLGIAIPSLTLEFTSYTIETGYQYGMGYPLDTYFETTLMWAQDVILFWVVLENRKMLNLRLAPYIAFYAFLAAFLMNRCFPDVVMYAFILSTTPIICSSKIVQLWKLLTTQQPGSLSALTWGLLSYLAGARVLTAIVITGDIPMFFNNFFATFLDIWLCCAIIYYNRKKRARRRS